MKLTNDNSNASTGSWLARLSQAPVVIALLLGLTTLAIFYPVAGHQLIDFDDPSYFTTNPQVQGGLTGANVRWAFTTGYQANWHPLTWLSLMLDAQWFGPGPVAPHVTNLLFHVANTMLLFWVLRLMTGTTWPSAFVAALFGWHPLHVESVAWVAERKDVLSTFFFMLTLWSYACYAKGLRVQGSRCKAAYCLALIFFVCGLMSKAMLVTLPFLLLLLDIWPLQRLQIQTRKYLRETAPALLLEKIPFFAAAIGSSFVTFLVQKHAGAVQPFDNLSAADRVENALVSYARYLGKTFWPFGLATPYSDADAWPALAYGGAALLLLALTILAVWQWRRFPFMATGWFWFFGTLVPVIGLVQVGAQSMADRYTYLPLIGVFIIVAWGAGEIFRWRGVPSAAAAVLGVIVLLACGFRTRDQLRYWQSTEKLFGHTLAVTRNNWIADFNLGWELDHQGRNDEALEHYRRAAEVKPDDPDCLNCFGYDLMKKSDYADALPLFEKALNNKPSFLDLHYNIATALLHLGRFDEAIEHYRAFLKFRPGNVTARDELGVALGIKGRLDEAVAEFHAALKSEPNNPEVHFNLGKTLFLQHQDGEAKKELTEALRLRPGWADAERELHNLGSP